MSKTDGLRLYRVPIESFMYVLARSEREAERVARDNLDKLDNGEFDFSASTAVEVYDDWPEAIPFHPSDLDPDIPDRTCAEWIELLKQGR
jgi:hypothetical protein